MSDEEDKTEGDLFHLAFHVIRSLPQMALLLSLATTFVVLVMRMGATEKRELAWRSCGHINNIGAMHVITHPGRLRK